MPHRILGRSINSSRHAIGPNFPKGPDHTRMKEAKFLKGCTPRGAHQSNNQRCSRVQERQKARFQQRRYDQALPAVFRRAPGPYQRDYYTSANHEGLHGVKDSRGTGWHDRQVSSLGFGVARHPSGA
jgi:hypothetical protein